MVQPRKDPNGVDLLSCGGSCFHVLDVREELVSFQNARLQGTSHNTSTLLLNTPPNNKNTLGTILQKSSLHFKTYSELGGLGLKVQGLG